MEKERRIEMNSRFKNEINDIDEERSALEKIRAESKKMQDKQR
jgi:hypothetical protein